MRRIRIIPVLLVHNGGLVKSRKFKNYTYVGDPINAVRIFNEKETDEIVIVDIDASRDKRGPDMRMIEKITGEAFMPLAYGGGISNISEVKQLFYLGVEKIILNRSAVNKPELIKEAASIVGSQSVVVSIDVKKNWLNKYKVYTENGTGNTNKDPVEFAMECEKCGAGEIFLNAIDRDGTYEGYDLEILKKVSAAVSIPVIACGGAGSVEDFRQAVVDGGASAVSAGSMFVFQRPHNAVLISYPSQEELKEKIYNIIA